MTTSDGAACYFCFGEEADEEGGMPLVRDCSCRGNSGFAHLACLTAYAEQKSKATGGVGDVLAFIEPWEKCNYCKQPYMGQLSIDLASKFESFAETTYGQQDNSSKWDKMNILAAIRFRIEASQKLFALTQSGDMVEWNKLVRKLLSMVDQTKKDFNMNGWVHMPKDSDEYKYAKMLCGSYEAFAYESLGLMEFTKEGINNATLHMKKAFEIYNLFGMTDALTQVETRIAFMQGANNEDVSLSTLQTFKKNYDDSISENGMNSIVTISAGMCYGMSLWEMGHYIEGERLMTKLATTSRRVLGPEHNITINADKSLKQFKGRYVIVLPELGKMYQALRYDNDGQVCVIQGPISDPRQVDDEGIHHTAHNLVIPTNGCPVICHGLVSASHLNGELGVVRNIKENVNGIRLAVHFDQMNLGLGSALVKPENLRVAFELPSRSNEEVVILQPPIVD